MINERIIKRLKQTNISTDPEKTKVRVYELWKASTKAQKNAVEEMAGISRATIYRVYNTGSISAKLVTPMAQNFNVNPDYLIAKTDEKGEYTDEIVIKFLTDLGYEDVLKSELKTRKRKPREKSLGMLPSRVSDMGRTLEPIAAPESCAEVTAEELQLLLQSLLIKEKAGSAVAVAKAAEVRALLLS